MILREIKEFIELMKWLIASLLITLLGSVILFISQSIEGEELKIFLREFGVAFIIAGIVSFVYEYFLRVGLVELIIEKLHIDKSISDGGLKSIYSPANAADPLKDFQKIIFFLEDAKRKIKLLGITTDFYFKLGKASPSYEKIINFIDSGSQIQILMLDPDPTVEEIENGIEVPSNVVARAIAENDDPKSLQEKIKTALNSRLYLKKKYGDLVQIKLYNTAPVCAMTILDKKMKVTPYLYGKVGLQSPTYEFEKNSGHPLGLFQIYEEHFDLMWKNSREVMEILFSWNDVAGKDKDKLIKFLTQEFSIDEGETAKIEKIDGNKGIKVTLGKKYFLLKLNDEKTKLILKIEGGRTNEYFVVMQNGKQNIYKEKYP